MMAPGISGRVWVLLDREGRLIADIDTDQIFHNAHLHITEREKMGAYALGNLEGWEDFPKKVRSGDILVAGRNFGSGSSRQQAVDCFLALGIAAILAPSFGAIYFRNAVNAGLAACRAPELEATVEKGLLRTGDELELDFLEGKARVLNRDVSFKVVPMSQVQVAIYRAGGLLAYSKTLDNKT
ncbi:MAG: 3-isopropylmalate dehydratase [Candidatus Aminicenantales bacterium]